MQRLENMVNRIESETDWRIFREAEGNLVLGNIRTRWILHKVN